LVRPNLQAVCKVSITISGQVKSATFPSYCFKQHSYRYVHWRNLSISIYFLFTFKLIQLFLIEVISKLHNNILFLFASCYCIYYSTFYERCVTNMFMKYLTCNLLSPDLRDKLFYKIILCLAICFCATELI